MPYTIGLHLEPETHGQMAEALRDGAARGAVRIGGAFSKDRMAGPIAPAGTTISTRRMSRVIGYEPRDLTVGVEAGLPFAELSRILAANRQMLPLDPPFASGATIGGVVAANCSGPRRRLYGTARDLVIGMKFATVEGKLVSSGGMVVKNVAGLDMAKLMIGSFGTLAAIASVNFKVIPMPPCSRTWALSLDSPGEAIGARGRILNGPLQPAALDLLNPQAAALAGLSGFALLVQAGGSTAVLERYSRELPAARAFEGDEEARLWDSVREFTPRFLAASADGAVVRASCALTEVGTALASFPGPALARAGSGVCYGYFSAIEGASEWMRRTAQCGWKSVIEFAPPEKKAQLDLWPAPGAEIDLMKRVKGLFDPRGVLNAGRLYGRI